MFPFSPQCSPFLIFWDLFDCVQETFLLEILPDLVSVTRTFSSIAFQPIFIYHLWCARHWAIIIHLWTHSSTFIEFLLDIGHCASDWDTKMSKITIPDLRSCSLGKAITNTSWQHEARIQVHTQGLWSSEKESIASLWEGGLRCIAQCLAHAKSSINICQRSKNPSRKRD